MYDSKGEEDAKEYDAVPSRLKEWPIARVCRNDGEVHEDQQDCQCRRDGQAGGQSAADMQTHQKWWKGTGEQEYDA